LLCPDTKAFGEAKQVSVGVLHHELLRPDQMLVAAIPFLLDRHLYQTFRPDKMRVQFARAHTCRQKAAAAKKKYDSLRETVIAASINDA
jgi:hypothetical protein